MVDGTIIIGFNYNIELNHRLLFNQSPMGDDHRQSTPAVFFPLCFYLRFLLESMGPVSLPEVPIQTFYQKNSPAKTKNIDIGLWSQFYDLSRVQ